MDTFSQNQGTDRQPVAAGRFYSAGKSELTKEIAGLFNECNTPTVQGKVRALVSPHAGYVFSGRTAAAALSTIPRDTKFSNIFIIGSSHIMPFEGASVYFTGDFRTPFGKAVVNREIANSLVKGSKVFSFPTTAHDREHSIEVQVPLLQYYFPDMPPIVPVIIGTSDKNTVRKIATALQQYFTPDNLFIISSDFSHYPSYSDAVAADRATALGIASGDPETFLSTLDSNERKLYKGLATSMCGWTSGLTLLYLTEGNKNLEYKLVDYTNSGDSPYGGKSEVVGYNAIAVFEKSGPGDKKPSGEGMYFTVEERDMLFSIARSAIESRLEGGADKKMQAASLPANLLKPYG
ncbi:MAG: AmmeMemoRadiSam system protein B, partial [Bacteroidales bacterium]|nr:AmmeMemoRadiSam system protein B [Bacteroidales bacterium]